MKTMFKTAILATLSLAGGTTAALAQTANQSDGHYEWQAARQYGPRTQLQAPQRVWVTAMATPMNCSMIQDKAAADRKTPSKGD